jgi:hypothetical protein
MSERLLVPFAGSGAGEGPLSWGQRLMWNAMARWGSTLALGGTTPLPPGLTVDDLAGVLGRAVSRHPSLRTTYGVGPDGEPRQTVHPSGSVALELVDSADPMAAAEELRARYQSDPFDGWPVRMAVVRHDGVPAAMVAIYSHLSLDGAGLDALVADSTDPVTAASPLDQAAWETGPSGRRHNAGTLRHWEKHLRAIPARRFPAPPLDSGPRFREVRLRSAALERAARAAAARTGLDTAAVLLAASATALTRVTGEPTTAQLIMVSNRFRAGFADSVSTVSQPGLCVIEAAADFDETVRRAWRASLAAYKHAYCDPSQRDALHEKISVDRAEEVQLTCYFNNRRTRPATAPVPDIPDEGPTWTTNPATSEPFFVTVDDDPTVLDLRVNIDTTHVTPDRTEAYLRELASALDPG